MSEKTVFISYRRDVAGRPFARSIEQALTSKGYDVFLDVDCLEAGKWAEQILTEIPKRAHFLLLLTPNALDRCTQENDWVRKEFHKAAEYGRNIVPICDDSLDLGGLRKSCPESMKTVFDYQIATIQHADFTTGIATLIERYIPPRKTSAIEPFTTPTKTIFHADISRIIKHAPAQLVGRECETKLLSDVWDQVVQGGKERPNVINFVALGGEGKTSLVAKWAANLAHQKWPGCEAVFAWSFYNQGTREQTAASSDVFLKEALIFFGDPEMAVSALSAFEKGRRLAHLVGKHRTLVILDGLEIFQYAPKPFWDGKLKDDGIAELLKGLAANNRGLCLVTSRYSIPDLQVYWQAAVLEWKLARLTNEAGAILLTNLGVNGTDLEKKDLCTRVKGHALTLTLLGSYLKHAHHGDIRRVDRVDLKKVNEKEQGGHAFRVIAAYELWFKENNYQSEVAILQMLGLFDRVATPDCLAVLCNPIIPGLSDAVATATQDEWNETISHLVELGLVEEQTWEPCRIFGHTEDVAAKATKASFDGEEFTLPEPGAFIIGDFFNGTRNSIDCHPLIREYFAQRLKKYNSSAWIAAHSRLFDYLGSSEPFWPEGLFGLQPLYQAIIHGCEAGRFQEACDNVYRDRICRVNAHYNHMKLGLHGTDAAILSQFFTIPWRQTVPSLTPVSQAWLLGMTSYSLRCLGRLTEANEPLIVALEMAEDQDDWQNAALRAGNLSILEALIGNVSAAVDSARLAVQCAKKSIHKTTQILTTATLADALLRAGKLDESLEQFKKAEKMLEKYEAVFLWLSSIQGYRYCDLLLIETERIVWQIWMASDTNRPLLINSIPNSQDLSHIERRAVRALSWDRQRSVETLAIALGDLTLARTRLFRALMESDRSRLLSECDRCIDSAFTNLHMAPQLDQIPELILTRAWIRAAQGQLENTQADLNEAWEIAERGPMRLHMADIHLYRARLFFREAVYPWNKNEDGSPRGPKDDLEAAEKLINQCGYHRRDEELADAKLAILGK